MTKSPRRVLFDPLLDENPVTLHVLGICSALAVTTGVAPALTMSLAFVVVVTTASAIIASIRRFIPRSTRLIVQVTIIASLVVVVDMALEAFAYDMSKRLSIFVSLIVTNCIVLGRAENFAMRNGVLRSTLDGLGNGAGYTIVLLTMGAVRELLGAGQLLGHQVLPLASDGGWFEPLTIFLRPPGAFFLLGVLTWLTRGLRPERLPRESATPAVTQPGVSHA